jgi:Tol biopolymer transport system component/DNA-binding winged helix-turn-helix (wHTH) protein
VGSPVVSNRALRFGPFEVDPGKRELRKSGLRVRLQEQPLQVLLALLEHPGEAVSREDLVRRLWADGTIVDFERGLNAAVNRLRQALSDSADVPRYVETVARRGYRFIGQVENPGDIAQQAQTFRHSRDWKTRAAVLLVSLIAAAVSWLSFTLVHARRADSELRVLPLTTGSGTERNPSFSPDGSQVVYEWQREDGSHHLYIKVVGSGDPIALTSGVDADYGPAWSPDGKLIAFLRQLDESTLDVRVVPPVGGVERKVAEIVSPSYWHMQQFHRRLDWTADSRHLVVSAPERKGGPEGLLLLGVDDGDKTWLSSPSGGNSTGDREPAVSPDGRLIAFARGIAGAAEAIYILPLSPDLKRAGPARLLASAGRGRSPAWMPDGKRVVFAALTPIVFESGISIVEVNGNNAPRPLLALGRNAAVPAVARTGRLAYSRTVMQGNIWKQEIPTRPGAVPAPVRLTDSSAHDSNAQYSPDGSSIAFASNRSGTREIWTCASDGQHCLQVTSFNNSFLSGTPRWSPDGKSLVFDSGAAGHIDIYVVSANGGPPRRLTDDTTSGMIPSWSHDGKWVYFCSSVTGRNEIWKIPSAGGKAVQVTRDGGFVAFDSPDGTTLYYTKTEQNATLFRRSLEENAETEVLSGVAHRGFAVAPDRIYYLKQLRDGSVEIRRFMLTTGKDSSIAPAGKDVFLGLDLSRDGKSVIYSQLRVVSNLMLVEPFR